MKARAYDHPEVVRLRKRIQSLEAHGLPYDHPRIEAIRSKIRALQIDRASAAIRKLKLRTAKPIPCYKPQYNL